MEGIIFMGIQASGKSTFYLQQFYKTHLRLNLDSLKSRNRECILFNACLDSKTSCVIDNTNPTKRERARYIEAFKAYDFKVTGYCFISGITECLQRNNVRKGKERIPDIAIRATRNKFEYPSLVEGFDRLYAVSITSNGFNIEDWKNEI
ncbi:AAA family ATPase [Pleionea sediminis]|uniref:AAA family ATPase n=1 Tax=Pleionea sediminis TaxID=2569479 RepID=UPI0011872752|nr:AAA family ATPase [Pleionea sediminis]